MISQHQTGVLAATTLLFTAASALAADINVPGDFATIGAAVAAAAPGDEIIIAPGVYNENIITVNKTLTIRSTDGPEATIVDGGGVGGRIITFANGSADSVLDGLTLTGGNATIAGGGFQISDAAAGVRISNCIIRNNHSNGGGGGARIQGVDAVIVNCRFTANTADGLGGALRIGSPPTSALFINCLFNANQSNLGSGGVDIEGEGANIEVVNCSFGDNVSSGGALAGMSDCCMPNGTPGCDVPVCQAQVCGQDSFCCEVEWDQICADIAAEVCDVCAPNTGDCCAPNGTPGCEDAECQNVVCDQDPFCCNNQWDQLCADQAAKLCDICAAPPAAIGAAIRATGLATVTVVNSIARRGPIGTLPIFAEQDGGVINATYSNIHDGWPGEGNINDNGPWVDPNGADNVSGTDDDDYRLVIGGDGTVDGGNTLAGVGLMASTDLLGQCRVVDQPEIADGGVPAFGAIDMGAIEAQVDAPVMEDPCPADLNNDGVVNAGDLAVLLAAWGACP